MKPPINTLAKAFPDIANSWDHDRNGDLTPADVAPFSRTKVWWKCDRCGESWPASVASRTSGRPSGCGFCAGKRVSPSRSLEAQFPDIAKHWDVDKNGSFKPSQILPKTSRKAWWICDLGHSYHSRIAARVAGRGCPICSGNIVIESTSLAAKFPKLAESWHAEKNFPLTTADVAPKSSRQVWWRCQSGHEWLSTVANRASAGSGCPYCGGQKTSSTNSLLAINPELAAEWHSSRNGEKTPAQFTALSSPKVWWSCPRGHEWPATIASRQYGAGCPFCGGGTSALEARVFTELKALFSDVIWHSSAMGVQVDVLLPTLRIGVEIDGHYWHSEKVTADLQKNATCETQGVRVIRLRQLPLKKLNTWDIEYLRSDTDLSVIQRLVSTISAVVANADTCKIVDSYLNVDRLLADAEYRKIIANLPSPPEGASFGAIFPKAAAEWHGELNAPLEPSMFAPKANRVVWWKCLAKGHEWQAAIHTRAVGVGCPCCANKKIGADNSLAIVRPDLIREWNYEKNLSITPDGIAPKSSRKVWWRCLARGHEWEATVDRRAKGSGCPYCSGLYTDAGSSLAALHPEIAATWDSEKNAPLRPEDVRSQSGRKVWWKCAGCGTSWQANVQHRVIAKFGCPKCCRTLASEQMRLSRLKLYGTLRDSAPELATRWHPTRNVDLTPDDVGRQSTKLVWWLCPGCGHEWNVSPHYYRRCPECGAK